MPIQSPFTQPDGTAPTFHVITGSSISYAMQTIAQGVLSGNASVTVGSWMDQAHFQDLSPQVAETNFDITSLIGTNATYLIIEQYLLSLPQFMGGQQIAIPSLQGKTS